MPSLWPIAGVFLAACASDANAPSPVPDKDSSVPSALVPKPAQIFAASVSGQGARLADSKVCGVCHAEIVRQHNNSAHAFASFNNPIYRASVERLRTDRGKESSLVCAACHDPALLVDGAMLSDVATEDPRARAGIGCRICHGIVSTTYLGNGSYQLQTLEIPLPTAGDPESLEIHRQAVTAVLDVSLCASCHQSFLSPASGNREVLPGQNEHRSWADSAYTGQGVERIDDVATRTCIDCHMPKLTAKKSDSAADTRNKLSSHQFLGGHTWLASMQREKALGAEIAQFLQSAATIDTMFRTNSGGVLEFDVVIRNVGVGHRFPAGVRDASEVWVEVVVLDAAGQTVLQSSEQEVHRLQALVADSDGKILRARETHEFAVLIADHTIGPRDVAVVRYSGSIPNNSKPVSIVTKLLHRSRSEALQEIACVDSTESKSPLDACADQPITVLTQSKRALTDDGGEEFSRHYELGLGLLHETQDRLSEAERPLRRALTIAILAQNKRQESMAQLAIAKIQSQMGRADEAIVFTRKAERHSHYTAASVIRGDALARVWRWTEAAQEYRSATINAPRNASLWQKYALALGSAGKDYDALNAAQTGLRLHPTNPNLLRIQALSLKVLGATNAEFAMDSYLEYRGNDNDSAVKLKCIAASEECAMEIQPVHTHKLFPTAHSRRDR